MCYMRVVQFTLCFQHTESRSCGLLDSCTRGRLGQRSVTQSLPPDVLTCEAELAVKAAYPRASQPRTDAAIHAAKVPKLLMLFALASTQPSSIQISFTEFLQHLPSVAFIRKSLGNREPGGQKRTRSQTDRQGCSSLS